MAQTRQKTYLATVLVLVPLLVASTPVMAEKRARGSGSHGASKTIGGPSLQAAGSATARRLSPEEQALVGTWKNDGGYSYIDTTFEFRPDGTYFYDAGRVSAWRVSHEGTFSIRPSRLKPTDRILVLTPARIITEPPREGQIALEVNRRMDNSPREFKISDSRGFQVPTKTLQDLDRDPTGAMQWWMSRNHRP